MKDPEDNYEDLKETCEEQEHRDRGRDEEED